jgi:hypothetical protein
MWLKIKEFFIKYESKIILVIGFALVAVLSFEAGVMKSAKISQGPVIIEKTALNGCEKQNDNPPEGQNLAQVEQKDQSSTSTPSQNCAYIGSKNSNKYHLPTCRWAKNIKPENLICFKDKNDAESKGYLPDKNCIK